MAIDMLDLPPELLEEVAKQLNAQSIFNFRRVSQYIQAATRHHFRIRFFRTRSITLNVANLRQLLDMPVASDLAKAVVSLTFKCHDDNLATRQPEKTQHAESSDLPGAPCSHSTSDETLLFRVLSQYTSLKSVHMDPIKKYYEDVAADDGYNITNSFSIICAVLARHPARISSIEFGDDFHLGITDVAALASMGRKLRTLRILDITFLGFSKGVNDA